MVASRDITCNNYPLVYSEWKRDSEERQEHYVIQDLPPEDDDLVLRVMLQRFMRDAPTCKSLNAVDDDHAKREMGMFWREKLAMRTSLACYSIALDGTKTLVGFNVCYVSDRHVKEEDILPTLKSVALRQILCMLSLLESKFNPYEALQVDRYLSAAGLFVSPELRGRGIAVELVKAREALCKVLGVTASATVFTASASQHVATKCGFRVLGEMRYEDLAPLGWHFPNIETPIVKLMGRRYDE